MDDSAKLVVFTVVSGLLMLIAVGCGIYTAYDVHKITASEDDRGEIATQLSEHGGYISTGYTYVYTNSSYHVEKGSAVFQDNLGIWIKTKQNGCDKTVYFHWDEIDAIMLDKEGSS